MSSSGKCGEKRTGITGFRLKRSGNTPAVPGRLRGMPLALDLAYEGCLSHSREIETAQFEVTSLGVLNQIRQFMLQNVI